MTQTFRPPDNEFAASSGSNVNWDPDWSYFDHPPNSTTDLTITSNTGDTDPGLFETGEYYDLTWGGHGGGSMDDAEIIRSDYIGPGQGAIVFEGINSNTGELFQIVWSPGFDLETWYWDNGGGPSSPNAFWTSDQDSQEFQYLCYAKGTLIDTPSGPHPIETLKVGDLVNTLDNGPKPIRWVRRNLQPLDAIETDKTPIRIGINTLGNGHPTDELIVSPQHRIFVGGRGQLTDFFEAEYFVPAKSLTKLRGIQRKKGMPHIVWYHFACDQHEIVYANGCCSESLLLGPVVLNGMTTKERQSVFDVFGPGHVSGMALNGPPARKSLKVSEARHRVGDQKHALKKRASKNHADRKEDPLMKFSQQKPKIRELVFF